MISVPYTIKNLYHQDHCYKNIRIHFPNGERSDICNNLIVKDSVSFTESLCSQNTLKFGLCESPIFECEVVGVGNIKGATIEVSVEIECPFSAPGAEWKADLQKYVYSISYGTFVVDSCKRQADMNHRKIIAYNKIGVFDWKVGGPEKAKAAVMFSNQANYTPELVYCLGAAGAVFNTEIFNDTGIVLSDLGSYETIWSIDTWEYGKPGVRASLVLTARGKNFGVDAGAADSTDKDALYKSQFACDDSAANEMYAALRTWRVNVPSVKEYFEKKKYAKQGMSILANGGYAATSTDSEDWERKSYYLTKDSEMYVYPYMDDDFYTVNSSYTKMIKVFMPYKLVYKQYDVDRYGTPTLVHEKEVTVGTQLSMRKYKLKDEYSYLSQRLDFTRDLSADYSTILGKYGYFINFESIELFDYVTAWFELKGLFGYYNRFGILPVNIKRKFGLDPNTELYPSATLYPQGVTGGTLQPKDYQSCWYDDEYTSPIGYITCKYKDTNNKDVDFEYHFSNYTEDGDFVGYDLSNNYIIKRYTWTKQQITDICEEFEANVSGVSYMPIDFVGRGLPYVEAGDTFEILTRSNDSITTIVLNHTITGEQTLKDSYKSV